MMDVYMLLRACTANQHFGTQIQPHHYKIVGKSLIHAFGDVLGPAMTPEVETAWNKAYWLLAKMLIGREQQIYKDFGSWTGWRKFRIDRRVQESECKFFFFWQRQKRGFHIDHVYKKQMHSSTLNVC